MPYPPPSSPITPDEPDPSPWDEEEGAAIEEDRYIAWLFREDY